MVNRAVLFGAPSYSQKILNLGPIAYWPLNDASGTAAVELVAGMNGTYSGVDLAQAQAPFVAPLFGDGDFCNIYSAGLNALKAFFTEGTVSIWAKVSGAGVWSDGVARRIFAVISASNQEDYTIRRGVTNEQIVLRSNLGGTAEAVSPTGLTYTGWFHLAITVSDAADQMKAYINGAQTGTTQTGIGAASGNNLITTQCCIGSESTTPGNVWSGWLAHCAIFSTALSAANIANLYNWGLG